MNKEEVLNFLKNKNNLMIIGVIILGIIFMTAFGTDEKPKKEEEVNTALAQEQRLEEILSDIQGAGRVSVMITYEDTGEKDFAYEKRKNDTSYDEKAVIADGTPLIIKEIEPEVKGVIVTADGGDDIRVKKALSEAVSAVLGVDAHRICIYKKK